MTHPLCQVEGGDVSYNRDQSIASIITLSPHRATKENNELEFRVEKEKSVYTRKRVCVADRMVALIFFVKYDGAECGADSYQSRRS